MIEILMHIAQVTFIAIAMCVCSILQELNQIND